MKYIKITPTKYYRNETIIKLYIENSNYLNKIKLTLNILTSLEIISNFCDEIIIPVHDNGLINTAYVKRRIFKQETEKEEIIKKYLDIPNIFLFKGVNYIKVIV